MMARVRYIEALKLLYANNDQNLISKGRDSKVPNKHILIPPLNSFRGNYSRSYGRLELFYNLLGEKREIEL